MRPWIARAVILLACLAANAAHAAITCSVSSGGFSTAYDPTNPAANVTQSFFTVTCTRGLAGDPTSVDFSVRANDGANPQGTNNRAVFGGNFFRYDVYRNASCGSKWKGGSVLTGTLSLPTTGTFSTTVSYWGCVAAGIVAPAGTYLDTVTMTMTYGTPSATATSTFGVSISTPATCSITAAPGAVVFNYTSLGSAVNPSTSFGVTCTTSLPYTMALDVSTGTLLGLNYSLGLGTASSVGTGAQQTHLINGSMAGGQSGTCPTATCTATQVHNVTVTY